MTDYEKMKREHPFLMWKAGVMLNIEMWWYGVRQRFWLISSAAAFIMGWDTLGTKLERRVNHDYFRPQP